MSTHRLGSSESVVPLQEAVQPRAEKLLNPERLHPRLRSDAPTLLLLAAGKGTRFGQEPKCAQLVNGVPLARLSIDAFHRFSDCPAICVVGYRHEQVMAALGPDNHYVLSENPTGGTAFAAYEAFSVAGLSEANPILIITMGDRVVPVTIFRRLYEAHHHGTREADLTFLTAVYDPPRNRGKGRIIRDANRSVLGIIEQRDIDAIGDPKVRQSLEDITEGNCPLYAVRARTLREHLARCLNQNAQAQYYLTDLIESIRRAGGEIRTITTRVGDPEYDLLCSDVTRPMDLALLEGILQAAHSEAHQAGAELEGLVNVICRDRPLGQIASIAAQLLELSQAAAKLGFKADRPAAFGISGGRLRIAFMHPDMGRFYGPAWQTPTGAADASGREQIVVLMQASEDRQIHLTPTNPEFQEKICSIPADIDYMYPGAEVANWYTYEGFGTRMAERLLLSLGYFTDEELQKRKEQQLPLPPSSLWVSTSMRRPFSLVGNAIVSMRTVRAGSLGVKVQQALGKEAFTGLRIVTAGDIPRGGFSSSSAVTVATKNAINALFSLAIPPDLLVHLSCQAEYGTGVRAGSLDQATEQKGRAGEGTLLSSNPKDNYRILGTYPVPSTRFHMLFPYSVDRDRAAWKWSAGAYAAEPGPGGQTTGELRKLTGKAAELAALLLQLPLEQDFFKPLEDDLVAQGQLSPATSRWVLESLAQLPLLVSQEELRVAVQARRDWLLQQLVEVEKLDSRLAAEKSDSTLSSLFAGWRDPVLRRTARTGAILTETGVPLRAMLAYLFAEVTKNFRLIHHPEEWIQCVSRSQLGDRSFQIEPESLPDRDAMQSDLDWEKGAKGPALMERWLQRFQACPFDFNGELDDPALGRSENENQPLPGGNFFRGLALIDLAEAMLKRAFGADTVAVRINAAGQGDYFQVHIDTTKARVSDVKEFIRQAFYRRFDLTPEQEFVEPHPGGGALGLRLERFHQLEALARTLAQRAG